MSGHDPIRSPIVWYGGKAKLADWIISHFPPHNTYVEVFGGSAAVLLSKAPSRLDVYNDVDDGLVGFFRILADPATFPAFLWRVSWTPYSRVEYQAARDHWQEAADPVERAARWYYAARASWAGKFGSSWSYSVTAADGATAPLKWFAVLNELPAFHARLARCQIEHLDWADCLARYDTPTTLFYLDPPYVWQTREAGPQYRHEFTDADHARLVTAVQGLRGMAILSGYDHPLYAPLEAAGWKKETRTVSAYAGNARQTGGRSSRQEVLWCNPAVQARQQQIRLWEGGDRADEQEPEAEDAPEAAD
jgi:DNA adenine methylase